MVKCLQYVLLIKDPLAHIYKFVFTEVTSNLVDESEGHTNKR